MKKRTGLFFLISFILSFSIILTSIYITTIINNQKFSRLDIEISNFYVYNSTIDYYNYSYCLINLNLEFYSIAPNENYNDIKNFYLYELLNSSINKYRYTKSFSLGISSDKLLDYIGSNYTAENLTIENTTTSFEMIKYSFMFEIIGVLITQNFDYSYGFAVCGAVGPIESENLKLNDLLLKIISNNQYINLKILGLNVDNTNNVELLININNVNYNLNGTLLI